MAGETAFAEVPVASLPFEEAEETTEEREKREKEERENREKEERERKEREERERKEREEREKHEKEAEREKREDEEEDAALGQRTVSTFTLKPEIETSVHASFVCYWDRETYYVQNHLEGEDGRQITTKNAYIQQGLRDLGIFTES